MTIQLAMMKRYIESCWFDKENNRGQGFLLVFVFLLVVFHVTDKSLLDKAHDRSFVVRNTYYNATYLDLNICRQFHGESFNESFFIQVLFIHTHTPHTNIIKGRLKYGERAALLSHSRDFVILTFIMNVSNTLCRYKISLKIFLLSAMKWISLYIIWTIEFTPHCKFKELAEIYVFIIM